LRLRVAFASQHSYDKLTVDVDGAKIANLYGLQKLYRDSEVIVHSMFHNNFGKCKPNYNTFSPEDFRLNVLKDSHLTCDVLLHYLVKAEDIKKC